MAYRLTEAADTDIRDILRHTQRRFGPVQRRSYAVLIERAANMIGDQPERPGSRGRDELGPGVRSFHVELAGQRRGAAAHVLYYVVSKLEDRSDSVIILRLLYDRMDPTRHIDEAPG